MKKIFTQSDNFKPEYSAIILNVGEIIPIPNSDFLGKTIIDGVTMIVRKDQVKEGDTVIYCPIETQLNSDFLSKNNLYGMECKELNSNFKEVHSLLENGKKDEAKKIVGFFNKYGRIRMIRLKGIESMGFIINIDDLKKWQPNITLNDIQNNLNVAFDTINNQLFIQAYIPPVKNVEIPSYNSQKLFFKRMKKLNYFNRIIPGTFTFHYDTKQLNREINKITPNDIIHITEKLNGTSFILANIPVKRKLSFIDKIKKIFSKKISTVEYDVIASSRNVIKNKYINPNKGMDFYDIDIWTDIKNKIGKYIERDMTIYGECVGYVTGKENSLIQKKGKFLYTYGCEPSKNKIMPYRINTLKEDGTKKEWNVTEIETWVNNLLDLFPDLKGYLIPPHTFYHGKASDLYPELDIATHWHENFLEKLKNDKNMYMECDEPLCPKGTPSEGIVIRIDDDNVAEAFKLKCIRYMEAEAKDIDNGIIDDETLMNYGN